MRIEKKLTVLPLLTHRKEQDVATHDGPSLKLEWITTKAEKPHEVTSWFQSPHYSKGHYTPPPSFEGIGRSHTPPKACSPSLETPLDTSLVDGDNIDMLLKYLISLQR